MDPRHALDEGARYGPVAEWRAGHEGSRRSAEREALGDPDFTVDDTTVIVAEGFRVMEVLV